MPKGINKKMETKMDYERIKMKFEKVLRKPLLTATLLGIIPLKDSKMCKFLTTAYFLVNSSALLITFCQICNKLIDSSPQDVNKVIEIILNALVFFSGFVLMIMYKMNVHQLMGLLSLAFQHFRFHSQYAKDNYSIEGTLDLLIVGVPFILVSTYASSYQWLILPIFFSDSDGSRMLPVDMTYPYPAHQSPYYELSYLLQAYLFTLLAFVYSHVTATFTSLTILVCTQYDLLYCNIRDSASLKRSPDENLIPTYNCLKNLHVPGNGRIPDEGIQSAKPRVEKRTAVEMEKNTLKAIADCVELHKGLQMFCRELQGYFNLPFTFQILMVVFTMGCAVISFLQKFAMNTFQFTMISVAFLSILCFQGQQILHKSGRIHEAAWQSEWERHGARVRRAYVFIMQQAIFPEGLDVGYGLFQLNLANLIAILRASFSFFTLLDNMIKPDQKLGQ